MCRNLGFSKVFQNLFRVFIENFCDDFVENRQNVICLLVSFPVAMLLDSLFLTKLLSIPSMFDFLFLISSLFCSTVGVLTLFHLELNQTQNGFEINYMDLSRSILEIRIHRLNFNPAFVNIKNDCVWPGWFFKMLELVMRSIMAMIAIIGIFIVLKLRYEIRPAYR